MRTGIQNYKIAKPVDIKTRVAYNFYKKQVGLKKNRIKRFEPWRDVIDAFWKEVTETFIEDENGVYVKGLGYIALFMSPYKKAEFMFHHTKGPTKLYNYHTDNRSFHPTIFTELGRGGSFNYFTMDRAFNQKVTRRISKNLRKGKKYFLRYTLIKNIFKGR